MGRKAVPKKVAKRIALGQAVPAKTGTTKKIGATKKTGAKKASPKKSSPKQSAIQRLAPEAAADSEAAVLDRLHAVVVQRRTADPAHSHSARLLSRGAAKVAQKFGEEAVECLIEAVAGNAAALVSESADVLYHLIVMWVAAGVTPDQVWAELIRREGVSGVSEKASRGSTVGETTKIP